MSLRLVIPTRREANTSGTTTMPIRRTKAAPAGWMYVTTKVAKPRRFAASPAAAPTTIANRIFVCSCSLVNVIQTPSQIPIYLRRS